jgi:hypothetical protein
MSLRLRVPRHAQANRDPARNCPMRGRLDNYSGEDDVFRELSGLFLANHAPDPFDSSVSSTSKLEIPPLRTIGDSSPLVCLKIL